MAAAEILQEAGWEAFNTNAVASRAGVSITAVYSYFPDKYAIVHEIFTRMSERRGLVMAPYIEALETQELETTIFEGLKKIAQLRIDERAGLTMRAIYRAIPELRSADREDDRRTSAALAAVFRTRNPRVPADIAAELAFNVVVALTSAVDYSVQDGRRDDRLLKSQTHMVVTYVNEVLDSY
jgi:AcrR family transcriptional regulator